MNLAELKGNLQDLRLSVKRESRIIDEYNAIERKTALNVEYQQKHFNKRQELLELALQTKLDIIEIEETILV